MKKRIALCLSICMLLSLLLIGCRERDEDIRTDLSVPDIPEDYVYLASENVYLNYSSWQLGSIYISLVSGSPLTDSEVEVTLNSIKLSSEHYGVGSVMGLPEMVEMPFYVYQIYRGKDWTSYAQQQLAYQELLDSLTFEKQGEFNEAAAELEKAQNEFLEDYLYLQEQGRLPVLYNYLLVLHIPNDPPLTEEPITEIGLSVKGQEYTFPVGSIQYHADSEMPDTGVGLRTKGGIAGWHCVQPNAQGLFAEKMGSELCLLMAMEDITITDIGLWEDTRCISDIQVVIENRETDSEGQYFRDELGKPIPGEIVADFFWDGKTPIELWEGQTVYFNFTFHEPTLANKLSGYTQYYLAIHYTDARGNDFCDSQWFPTCIQTIGADPHELYLSHELDIDVMSYYTEYFFPLNDGGIAQVDTTNTEGT